ncbi:methanol dehydrogenase [Pedobacter yulinensis]|uniref:Methanol dehydrogenase n=1 Tax=Pedobacter yulinensis TaxID=2126353 RepID=A0A2T3HQA0_9SPHI|nr:TPM domain-containing protein [Pedobacter yulinensis]PST84571.1 methanol dehydrogenase [Pedobacter yulinensis]
MKKILAACFFIFSTFLSFAQDFPAKPATLVNDYTGTLSATEKQQLESKLVAFNDSTSTQIAIAILKSVGDYDINEYTLELGRKWGVGQAGKNNGIMIVVAVGDRKISIQTGYGLEGALPDVYAKRIIENDIKPYFKAGRYYEGLDAGTSSIISYTKGEYRDKAPAKITKDRDDISVIGIVVIIIIVIFLIKRGGGGGGSQVIGGRGAANALWWAMLFGSGGGRSGGGGWGGGSSGGGGFGGFGGGSFGGGGSSGSW